jgi:hypothetical protein
LEAFVPRGLFPPPETWQTRIVVWSIDDRAKEGDPRFWWSEAEAEKMRRLSSPELLDRVPNAGAPKGRSLASLRQQFGGDDGELVAGGASRVTLSTGDEPTTAVGPGLPEYRVRLSLERWKEADPEKTYLIINVGSGKHKDASMWNPAKALELSPTVFVQDERPSSS